MAEHQVQSYLRISPNVVPALTLLFLRKEHVRRCCTFFVATTVLAQRARRCTRRVRDIFWFLEVGVRLSRRCKRFIFILVLQCDLIAVIVTVPTYINLIQL